MSETVYERFDTKAGAIFKPSTQELFTDWGPDWDAYNQSYDPKTDLTDAQWIGHFGRFEPLPDNLPQPLAQRYHGHQFRVYNPEIGDGRGFLFAQLRDGAGRLMDLGTKGSGQTPYSRFGDGRLTVKGAVRELLATEMLEALGVETSKTFSIVETGEALERNDEPSPTRSAVLVRLSHGHIRIGTFQRLAFFNETDNIGRLTNYCLTMQPEPSLAGAASLIPHARRSQTGPTAPRRAHLARHLHSHLSRCAPDRRCTPSSRPRSTVQRPRSRGRAHRHRWTG